jgi:hypothetical protein
LQIGRVLYRSLAEGRMAIAITNLEIHVPQAFAADVLLVSFGAEKSWINDRVACVLRS